MDDKIVQLQTVRPLEVSPMVAELRNFEQAMVDTDSLAFAAVCIDAEGEITTSWYNALPTVAMMGGLELLKAEYIQSLMFFEEDE